MANWIGTSRTNYVTIADMAGLHKALEPFDISTEEEEGGKVALFSEDEFGDWPGSVDAEDDDGEEIELEFSFEEYVMPYVAEGEVLVTMLAGAEKQRYVSGHADAFIRHGGEVRKTCVNINNIYALAAKEFGVPVDSISRAEY